MFVIILSLFYLILGYLLIGLTITILTRSKHQTLVIWWLPILIIMALIRAGELGYNDLKVFESRVLF